MTGGAPSTLPRYSTVNVRPSGLDGRGSWTRQTYSSSGSSTYRSANSRGVSTPSRWNSRSLSVHCQSKRSGGVPRWMHSTRWTTLSTSAFAARAASVPPAANASRTDLAPWRSRLRSTEFIGPVFARAVRLRHERLRHQAVLGDDGHEHVPLAAVLGRCVEEIADRPVVQVTAGRLDDGFEEVVGPLDLVPEHGVVLGELELLEAHLLHRAHAQQVEPGEQPAPAAALLVGDLPVVQQRGQEVVGAVDDLPVDGHVVHGHLGHRVLCQPVGRVRGEILAEQFQLPRAQRSAARTPPPRPRSIPGISCSLGLHHPYRHQGTPAG